MRYKEKRESEEKMGQRQKNATSGTIYISLPNSAPSPYLVVPADTPSLLANLLPAQRSVVPM